MTATPFVLRIYLDSKGIISEDQMDSWRKAFFEPFAERLLLEDRMRYLKRHCLDADSPNSQRKTQHEYITRKKCLRLPMSMRGAVQKPMVRQSAKPSSAWNAMRPSSSRPFPGPAFSGGSYRSANACGSMGWIEGPAPSASRPWKFNSDHRISVRFLSL